MGLSAGVMFSHGLYSKCTDLAEQTGKKENKTDSGSVSRD